MKHLLALLVLTLLPACKSLIVRDGKTYSAELAWFQQAMTQTASLAQEMVNRHCTCEDGYFTDPTCEDLADNILVIDTRAVWHIEMAKFNARLINERPPAEPPEIPLAETLCPPEQPTEGDGE